MLSLIKATKSPRERISNLKDRSLKLTLMLRCSEVEHGKIQSSRNTTSMPRDRYQRVVTFTHFLKSELSSEKFFLRWDSTRCQRTSSWRAHSGTSMLFSSHRAIPLEICTILSSLKSQSIVKVSQMSMAERCKMCMRKEDMDQRDINMIGMSMRPRKIF